MSKKPNSIAAALLAFLVEYDDDFKMEFRKELLFDLESKILPPKLFYNLKEVSHMTGLTIRAIKERYRRGTLQVVYDNTTPLIPADSLNELVEKLNRQILKKKRAA